MPPTATDSPINGLVGGHLGSEFLTNYIPRPETFTKETRDHVDGCPECKAEIKGMKDAFHSK